MTRRTIRISGLLLTWLLFSMPVAVVSSAQESAHNPESIAHGTHHYHPNLFAIFVGATHEGKRENGFTLGLEYERRMSEKFGIGVLAEHVFGDEKAWVFAVPFAYHRDRWKFYLAPGIEDTENGSEALLRVGGEYAFAVGEWEISPQLDIDFVDGNQVLVLGVVIGKGF